MSTPNPADDEIKKKKTSRAQSSMLVWVLMAMLIAGLGGFGVTNFGRSVTAIGSVGTQEIPVTTYARALRSQINALSRQFGQQLGFKEAQLFGIDQQVLSGLVANASLDNEAKRIGISVGNATVAKRVATDKNFHDLTGKFSADTYKQLLQQNNMSVRDYETGLRQDIARTVLQAAVVGGIEAPAALTDTLYAYTAEKRSFTLLPLTEASLPTKLVPPTDADLKAFYDANIAKFTRPEAKRITYAALLPADLAAKMTVAEADIQAAYDARKADYTVPEKRLVERLVYPTEAEAAAAKAKLDAGTSFETLVKDRGLALTDIDLGDVTKADLAEAGDAVFALTAPGVVGPLNSSLGPALFRMNAVLPAQNTTLADVHDTLKTELQTKAAAKTIADQTQAIEDALAGGATLEDLAKDNGMTLATIDYVAGAADNDPIAASKAFTAAADKLAQGDYPQAISTEDGGLIALRLDATVPPTAIPLDKLGDKVATAWHADALTKALTAQATTAETAVKGGADLGAQGMVTNIPATTRDATPAGTTPDVMKTAFTLALGEVKLIDTPDFTGLIRLDSITPADLTSDAAKAERTKTATQAQQSIAQDTYDLYTSAMTAQGGLVIDQTAIASVQSQIN